MAPSVARTAAMAALLMGMAASVSAAEGFQRELDGDCLPAGAQVPPGTSLFPERITGDEIVKADFFTQVRRPQGAQLSVPPPTRCRTVDRPVASRFLARLLPSPAAHGPPASRWEGAGASWGACSSSRRRRRPELSVGNGLI